MGFSDQLSWSVTRSRSLRGCLRAHWFSKFSRGEEEWGRAKLLSKLVSLDVLAGQVVDWQVEFALDEMREGREPPTNLPQRGAQVWKRMVEKSAREASYMRNGKGIPDRAQPLLSDYYGLPVTQEDLAKRELKVIRALEGFLSSALLAALRRVDRRRWKPSKSDLDFGAVEWWLDSHRVWSNLDFYLDYGAHGFVVIDWKSGWFSGPEESLQIAAYSLFGQTTRNLPRDRV